MPIKKRSLHLCLCIFCLLLLQGSALASEKGSIIKDSKQVGKDIAQESKKAGKAIGKESKEMGRSISDFATRMYRRAKEATK